MQLIQSPLSPFVRKVVVLLHETNQLDDVELVAVQTSPMDSAADALKANPTGKIPALMRPDGPSLYDSRVITRYLDARANAGLYPEGRLWETLTLEATADAIMDSAVSIAYEGRVRPAEMVYEPWQDAQWVKVMSAFSAINERWMSHLNGPLDMAQIAVACAIGYVDLRHDARNWRKGHDTLAAWYETFSQRPSMQATIPTA